MKCKITRKKEKERIKEFQTLFKKLEKLNPKRYFWTEDFIIHVDTDELWKITLPEDWEADSRKDREEKSKAFGFICVKKDSHWFFIYS